MRPIKNAFLALLALLTVLWVAAEPQVFRPATFFALRAEMEQYSGILAMGCMSVAMILALRPRWPESRLGGLDKDVTACTNGSASPWSWSPWSTGCGHRDQGGRLVPACWNARDAGRGPQWRTMPRRSSTACMAAPRAWARGRCTWYVVLVALALIRRFPYRLFYKTHRLLAAVYLALVFHAVVLTKLAYSIMPVGIVMIVLMAGGTWAAIVVLSGRVGSGRRVKGWIASLEVPILACECSKPRSMCRPDGRATKPCRASARMAGRVASSGNAPEMPAVASRRMLPAHHVLRSAEGKRLFFVPACIGMIAVRKQQGFWPGLARLRESMAFFKPCERAAWPGCRPKVPPRARRYPLKGWGPSPAFHRYLLLKRGFDGTLDSKYQLVSHLPPPNLQTTLTGAKLPVPIDPGVLRLQPLQQFSAGPLRLCFEPCTQLRRNRRERIRAPPQALGPHFGPRGRPHLAVFPCHAQPREEPLEGDVQARRWFAVDWFVGDLHKALLRGTNLTQQTHRIQGGSHRGHAGPNRLGRSWLRQQPLIRRRRLMIPLPDPRPVALLFRQLE